MSSQAKIAERLRRLSILQQIRPASLAAPIYKAAFPRLVEIDVEGLRLSVNPVAHLGRALLLEGGYETATVAIFRDRIRTGSAVLDIGANEGFFAALAASLVGPEGFVVAVEPQSRLQATLTANLERNANGRFLIAKNVVAERDGETATLSLFPDASNGGSGLVRPYRWGARTETVETVTPSTLLKRAGLERFDFVKIDVEGFEPEVVRSLPMDRVVDVLVDYHTPILHKRGLSAEDTHRLICNTHAPVSGDTSWGYVLYEPR